MPNTIKKSAPPDPLTVKLPPSGRPLGQGVLASTRLKKAGGSLIATVPAAARHLLHLEEGQEMAVLVEGERLVMEPMKVSRQQVRRPRYTLDELLAQCDSDAPLSEEERAWQDSPATGREIW